MTIYLVIAMNDYDEYYDKEVLAGFTTREKAEQYIENVGGQNVIEELEVN